MTPNISVADPDLVGSRPFRSDLNLGFFSRTGSGSQISIKDYKIDIYVTFQLLNKSYGPIFSKNFGLQEVSTEFYIEHDADLFFFQG
jgi:hypothetical protein